MTFLIVLITSIGLGHFFCFKKGEFFKLPGLYVFTGYIFIPILLFVFDFIFPGKLKLFSMLIFYVSLVSVIVLIVNNRKSLKEDILHPLWIFVLIIFLFYILVPCEYKIHKWDEFSHWLLMPKQMFHYGTLISVDFPNKNFASYTPGWTSLLTYPIFVLSNNFDISNVNQVAVVGSMSLLFLTYDIIRNHSKYNISKNYLLFVLLILFAALKLIEPLFPEDVLVEIPLTQVIFSTFLVLFLLENEPENINRNTIILLVILCGGYLVKKPYIIVLFVAVIGFFLILLKKNSFINIFIKTIIVLTPSLIFYYIWEYRCQNVREIWNITNTGNDFYSLIFSQKSYHIFSSMLIEFGKRLLIYFYFIPSLMIVISFLKKEKIGKIAFYSFIASFFTYFLGLYWTYLVAFGDYESTRLASFDRYTDIIFKPMIAFYCIFAFLFLWDKYHERLTFFKKRKYSRITVTLFFLLITLTTFRLNKIPQHQIFEAVKELNKENNNINKKIKLLLISQGSNGKERFKLNYYLLFSQYQIYSAYSFAKKKNNIWTTVVSESDLKNIISNNDYILVWNSDKWINSILKRNSNIDINNFSKVILKRNGSSYSYKKIKFEKKKKS